MRTIYKTMMPLISGFLCLLYTVIALAEEEAGHNGHEQITFIGDWLPRLINFAIIATVVVLSLIHI